MALRLWKGSGNSDCAWQHTVDGKVTSLGIFSTQEKENAQHGVGSGVLRIRFWWRNKEEKALHRKAINIRNISNKEITVERWDE